jgi:hypothetical protein
MLDRILTTGSQEEHVTTSLLALLSDRSARVDSQHLNTPGPSYALNQQP